MIGIGLVIKRLLGAVFDNGLGRAGVIAVAACGLLGWFTWEQRSIGATKAVASIEKQGEVKRGQAQEARRAARVPGAARRLLDEYCRDC